MTERKQYMLFIAVSTLSVTSIYCYTSFTAFTLPFVKLYTGKAVSSAILCLLCAASLILHWTALKRSWIDPGLLRGIIAGAIPAAFYSTMVTAKYSSAFIKAFLAAAAVSWLTVKAISRSKRTKACRIQLLLCIWTVFMFAASVITFRNNDTHMIRYEGYSNTIGADNGLNEKQQYSANKLYSLLPMTIMEDTPCVVMYAYLSPGEKIAIDGIVIKVSVQYTICCMLWYIAALFRHSRTVPAISIEKKDTSAVPFPFSA